MIIGKGRRTVSALYLILSGCQQTIFDLAKTKTTSWAPPYTNPWQGEEDYHFDAVHSLELGLGLGPTSWQTFGPQQMASELRQDWLLSRPMTANSFHILTYISWYIQKMVIHCTTGWDKPKRFATLTWLKAPAVSTLVSSSKDEGVHIRTQLHFIHSASVGKFWQSNPLGLPKRGKHVFILDSLLLQ